MCSHFKNHHGGYKIDKKNSNKCFCFLAPEPYFQKVTKNVPKMQIKSIALPASYHKLLLLSFNNYYGDKGTISIPAFNLVHDLALFQFYISTVVSVGYWLEINI